MNASQQIDSNRSRFSPDAANDICSSWKCFNFKWKYVVILSGTTHWMQRDSGRKEIVWRKIREIGVPDKSGNQSVWAVTHTVAFCTHCKHQYSSVDCSWLEQTENIPVVKAKKSLNFVSKYSLLVILEWGSALTLWLWTKKKKRKTLQRTQLLLCTAQPVYKI